jgi:hypothetical protein
MSWSPTGRNRLQFVAEEFWPGGGENGDGRDLYGTAEHLGAWREETTEASLIAEALHPSDAEYLDRVSDEEFDRELDEMEAGTDSDHVFLNGRPIDEYDVLPDGEDGPDSLELAQRTIITREVAIDPWCVVVPRRWNEYLTQAIEREAALDLDEDEWEYGSGPTLCACCTGSVCRRQQRMDQLRRNPYGLAANALERFERDGVRKQSLSTERAKEFKPRDERRRTWPNIGPRWLYDPVTDRVWPSPRWNGRPRYDSWKRHRQTQYRTRDAA